MDNLKDDQKKMDANKEKVVEVSKETTSVEDDKLKKEVMKYAESITTIQAMTTKDDKMDGKETSVENDMLKKKEANNEKMDRNEKATEDTKLMTELKTCAGSRKWRG